MHGNLPVHENLSFIDLGTPDFTGQDLQFSVSEIYKPDTTLRSGFAAITTAFCVSGASVMIVYRRYPGLTFQTIHMLYFRFHKNR